MSLGCAYNNSLCDRLSEKARVNRLNERDLSLDVSSNAVYISGIDLNTAVFDKHGYIANSSNILKDLLDAGLRRLYLDVYYDSYSKTWNLCPFRPPSNTNSTMHRRAVVSTLPTSQDNGAVPVEVNNLVCDYTFNLEMFFQSLYEYITLSDTNIAASLLYLHLQPRQWEDLPSNVTSTFNASLGSQSLNSSIMNSVGSRIMTPGKIHLQEARNKLGRQGVSSDVPRSKLWPDLRTVLYTDKNRMVITYNDSLISTIPELQNLQQTAFPVTNTIKNPENLSIHELASLNFTDVFVSDFAGWQNARKLGVSPVLSRPLFDVYSPEMDQILNYYEYWAWVPNEPQLYTIQQRKDMLPNGRVRTAKLAACAVFTRDGLEVANCNSHFPILCQNDTDSFDWVLTQDNHTYFDPDCPNGYHFSTPSTPLEARYLRDFVLNNQSLDAGWIDFNSLFLPNCWVTGGTNAVCPYNIKEYGRNGIGFIAAAGAVAFWTFVFIFFFEYDRGRSPLMKKNIKRDALRDEYEGIPS